MTTTATTWHHLPDHGVWMTTTCRRTVWWRERSDGAGVTFDQDGAIAGPAREGTERQHDVYITREQAVEIFERNIARNQK